MTSDRVIVNAGGRRFETTTTTLLSSGSAYFSALLGYTGSALGSLSRHLDETDTSVAITPHPNGRKRVRNEGGADEDQDATERHANAVKEIFIDRDPDLFENVLYFMRSTRLSSKCRKDVDRLEDLKDEALFFGFQELETACENALKELQDAIEKALTPLPKPKATCCGYIVGAGGTLDVYVPKGQVLYIVSATLAGPVYARRYEQAKITSEKKAAIHGCYLAPGNQCDSGDFQLQVYMNDEWISLAHVAVDHNCLDTTIGMNLDFTKDIRLCIDADPEDDEDETNVMFAADGSGDWHLACWIGDPAAIPHLNVMETKSTSRT